MRWEIFSRGRVISVCVWEWSVYMRLTAYLCICYLWVLIQSLICLGCWRIRVWCVLPRWRQQQTQHPKSPPATRQMFQERFPYYQLKAKTLVSASLATEESVMGRCKCPRTVAAVRDVMLLRCYSRVGLRCAFRAGFSTLSTALHTASHTHEPPRRFKCDSRTLQAHVEPLQLIIAKIIK